MSASDPFLSHYILDPKGRRTLIGLSFDETAELEELDARLPHDGKSIRPCSTPILPMPPMEVRWLELYRKHRAAFEATQKRRV